MHLELRPQFLFSSGLKRQSLVLDVAAKIGKVHLSCLCFCLRHHLTPWYAHRHGQDGFGNTLFGDVANRERVRVGKPAAIAMADLALEHVSAGMPVCV